MSMSQTDLELNLNEVSFAVLGAGSFGTAVANNLARRGQKITLWCRDPEQAASINANHKNPKRLKQHELDKTLIASSDLSQVMASATHVIVAVPTQSVRNLLTQLASISGESDKSGKRDAECEALNVANKKFLSLAKGIEISTGMMPAQIYRELLPAASFTALSGPSLAAEVVRDLPTAVLAASSDSSTATEWQQYLNSPYFRVYTSNDIIGVELGGAVKNVIAIAVGVARALNMGDNACAALATRGLAEIMRLGAAMGAEPLTLAGLAGVGDLMATCYSEKSRNLRFGLAIGRGMSPEEAAREIGETVEGAYTVKALTTWARKAGIELPISEGVNAILYEGASLKEIIVRLLFREPKPETIKT